MNRSSIYYMFANPRYAGQVPDPYQPGVFHKANYQPMITMEEYDQVQRILGKKGKPRFSASRQFALRGLIKCGDCGCSVTAETKQKTLANGEVHHYTYYHCTGRGKKPCKQRGSTREEDLFNQLNELLDDYDLTPKLYEWGMQALNEMAKKEVAERNDVQVMQFESITTIQTKLDKLLDLVTDGVITADQYKVKIKSLNEALKERQYEQVEMADRVKNWYEFVVPRVGFEPTTYGLELHCSIQLSYRGLVRDGRVEPVSSVWKTDILTAIRIPLATEVIISQNSLFRFRAGR